MGQILQKYKDRHVHNKSYDKKDQPIKENQNIVLKIFVGLIILVGGLNYYQYIVKVKLKNSEMWAKECLSLPMHPKMKILHASYVVREIKKYFKYD